MPSSLNCIFGFYEVLCLPPIPFIFYSLDRIESRALSHPTMTIKPPR